MSVDGDNSQFLDALDLPGLVSTKPPIVEATQITFLVRAARGPIPPTDCCGVIPTRNGTRRRMLRDLPLRGRFVDIWCKHQRLKCRCGKVSFAKIPHLDPEFEMTERATAFILAQAAKRTFADVGQELGVSETTVKNVFMAKAAPCLETELRVPRVLGIDEIYLTKLEKDGAHRRRKRVYRCVLGDVEQRTMLGFLKSPADDDLSPFLEDLAKRGEVEVVCVDMRLSYARLARHHFPRAAIVIDKFHVVRKANEVIDGYRKSIKDVLPKGKQLKLTRQRFTLLKREASWDKNDKKRIREWKNEFPELVRVFDLKEAFFDIFETSTTRRQAESRYDRWRKNLPDEFGELFRGLESMVESHRKRIFAYFDHRHTNAYVESLNRAIRDINRAGRGYSFPVLRAKLMMAYAHAPMLPCFNRLTQQRYGKNIWWHNGASDVAQSTLSDIVHRVGQGDDINLIFGIPESTIEWLKHVLQ